MSAVSPLPDPSAHDRLIAAARDWLLRSWGRHLVRVEAVFSDDSAVSLAPRSAGLKVQTGGTLLVGRPIDQQLFDAARAWGEQQRQEYPARLRIVSTAGDAAELDVPPSFPLSHGEMIPDAPHFDGPESSPGPVWSFTDEEAVYRGRSFRCPGDRQKLLRALAARAGQPVPNGELKQAVWGDRYFDDSQFRNLVCRLRTLLAEALDLNTKPIVAAGGSHKLTLV
jgi:hypothetical protein